MRVDVSLRCVLSIRELARGYRGTSLMRNNDPLGPYSRNMPMGPAVVLRRGAVSYERGTPVVWLTRTSPVYVYVVPWSEIFIVPSYPHYPHCCDSICMRSGRVGVETSVCRVDVEA